MYVIIIKKVHKFFSGLAVAPFKQESLSGEDGRNQISQQASCFVCHSQKKKESQQGNGSSSGQTAGSAKTEEPKYRSRCSSPTRPTEEVKSNTEPEVKLNIEPEVKSNTEPEVKSNTEPEVKLDTELEAPAAESSIIITTAERIIG